MYATSTRFRETITGSHRAVVRAQVLRTTQFGTAPTGGTELPILSGDVKFAASSDVKATLDITVPGDYWDIVQPFGPEIFVERGVAFGDGTSELVPLGYYRIDDTDQASAPYGPIRLDCSDRTAQMIDNRVLAPVQIADGTAHRAVFERLVNGRPNAASPPSVLGYGMFIGVAVPITWTGYDPDAVTVSGAQVVEDDTYEFLARLADDRGCVLRFREDGGLYVEPNDRTPDAPVDYTIIPGRIGNLVRSSRRTSRKGVYNVVSARGSAPEAPTGYQLAYNNDVNDPLYWRGQFGAVPRYYASPLLRTDAAALEAAETVLGRSTGLPLSVAVVTVPNPALRPLDVLSVQVGSGTVRHLADVVTVPLVATEPVEITTRTINPAGVIETQPDPTPTPEPETPPGTPDPGPGPAGDGTQTALLRSWGPVVDGDEFAYTGPPSSAKWSMYNGPGHDNNGLRRPSAFNVADGILTCTGDNISGGTTGGMAFKRDEYYCRIEVRLRTFSINPSAGGNRYHPVLITWPTSNEWPQGAEYDFFECDCDTGKLGWFLHYPNHQPKRQEGGERPLDIENWHNYAFEWSSSGLKGWVDGTEYFSYSANNIHRPPGPMHLTYQLDNFFGGNMCPAKMEAQWVRIYGNPG